MAPAGSNYNVTGCRSWKCSDVFGLTTVVPAVCPYCAWRAVCGGPCGFMLFVFTGTRRPFTSTDVSSTLSGSDLRGLRREALTFPNAFVSALNKTLPFTETFWAIFTSKLLPTASCEVIRLTVVTGIVVPAGIVAAFADKAVIPLQITAMTEILFVNFIMIPKVGV